MSENRNRTNDRPLFILQYLIRNTDDVKAIPAEDVNIVADRVPVPAVPACFANIHQLG